MEEIAKLIDPENLNKDIMPDEILLRDEDDKTVTTHYDNTARLKNTINPKWARGGG